MREKNYRCEKQSVNIVVFEGDQVGYPNIVGPYESKWEV
jgi:hypothetical protein